MKTISLWQPWASAIAAGIKTIETRGWSTNYRGPLAIHAAKRYTFELRQAYEIRVIPGSSEDTALKRIGVTVHDDLPRGAIVATCMLRDCVRIEGAGSAQQWPINDIAWGDFTAGRFGWVLGDIVPLLVPYPCVGRQGFFDCPEPRGTELLEGRFLTV